VARPSGSLSLLSVGDPQATSLAREPVRHSTYHPRSPTHPIGKKTRRSGAEIFGDCTLCGGLYQIVCLRRGALRSVSHRSARRFATAAPVAITAALASGMVRSKRIKLKRPKCQMRTIRHEGIIDA